MMAAVKHKGKAWRDRSRMVHAILIYLCLCQVAGGGGLEKITLERHAVAFTAKRTSCNPYPV